MRGVINLKAKNSRKKKTSNTTDINTNLSFSLLGLLSLYVPPITFIVSSYKEPNNQEKKWYMYE
jgi:hypothetical protein